MSNQQKSKKRQGSPWGILAVLLIIALRAISNSGYNSKIVPAVLALFVLAAALIAVGKSAAKKRQSGETPSRAASPASAARPTPSVELHRPAPSMKRREAPISSSNHFPQPEAYCVTCENTGEDHFVRDRNRRISQLDEWLKNGLIDKDEYRVLKQRFENDQ